MLSVILKDAKKLGFVNMSVCNLFRGEGVISLAVKVTVGLVESNSSLPPGLELKSPAG